MHSSFGPLPTVEMSQQIFLLGVLGGSTNITRFPYSTTLRVVASHFFVYMVSTGSYKICIQVSGPALGWKCRKVFFFTLFVAVALADHLVDFHHVTNSLFLSFRHHLFPLLGCT
jgi:hypothetical protein